MTCFVSTGLFEHIQVKSLDRLLGNRSKIDSETSRDFCWTENGYDDTLRLTVSRVIFSAGVEFTVHEIFFFFSINNFYQATCIITTKSN